MMNWKMKGLLICVMFLAGMLVLCDGRVAYAAERISAGEWKKAPTGSAGILEGKSVIISVFIDDKNSEWNRAAKKKANRKLAIAGKYLEKQAKRYKKDVKLVTDIYQNPDICYSYKVKQKINDTYRSQNKLYRNIYHYLDKTIPLGQIREKYGTDSIGFVFHINKSGVSSSYVHYAEEGKRNFYEASSVFTWCEGEEEGASTYAHELLHLFGARDLYEKCLEDGITMSFVRYVAKHRPNDIMFTTYTKNEKQLKYRITNTVSRITAYFLGWKLQIPELKKYPLMTGIQKGCFSDGTSM